MSSEQRLARRQGAGPVRPSLVIEPTHALVARLDRASDFESEGREFESLRARQDLGLEIKAFSQFRLRSICQFRVARRCETVQGKSRGYEPLPIIPRNTDATLRFVFRSRICSPRFSKIVRNST